MRFATGWCCRTRRSPRSAAPTTCSTRCRRRSRSRSSTSHARGVIEGLLRRAADPGSARAGADAEGLLLRALDLTIARRVEGLLPGDHRSSLLGRGSELAQIRPYEPVEDDVRQIDWNVTARTGTPHVRDPSRRAGARHVARARHLAVDGVRHGQRRKADVAEGAALASATQPPGAGTASGSSPSETSGRARIAAATGTGRPARPPPRAAPGGSRRAAPRSARRNVRRRGTAACRRARTPEGLRRRRLRLPRPPRLAPAAAEPRRSPPGRRRRDPRRARAGAAQPRQLSLVDPETGRQVKVDTSSERLRSRFAARGGEQERRDVAAELISSGARHVVLETRWGLAARADRLPPARGSPMSFASPLALLALLLVPVGGVAYLCVPASARARCGPVRQPALMPNLVDAFPGWRRHLPPAAAAARRHGFLVGFARPHATLSVRSEDATAILAIDTSRSMGATDVLADAAGGGAGVGAPIPRRTCRRSTVSPSSPSAPGAQVVAAPTRDREFAATRDRRAAHRRRHRARRRGGDGASGRRHRRDRERGRKPRKAPAPAAILVLSDGAARRRPGRARPRRSRRARLAKVPVFTALLGTQAGVVRCGRSAATSSGSRCLPTPDALRRVADADRRPLLRGSDARMISAPVYADLKSRLGSTRQGRPRSPSPSRRRRLLLLAGGPCRPLVPEGPVRSGIALAALAVAAALGVGVSAARRPRTSATGSSVCIPVAGPWVVMPCRGGRCGLGELASSKCPRGRRRRARRAGQRAARRRSSSPAGSAARSTPGSRRPTASSSRGTYTGGRNRR